MALSTTSQQLGSLDAELEAMYYSTVEPRADKLGEKLRAYDGFLLTLARKDKARAKVFLGNVSYIAALGTEAVACDVPSILTISHDILRYADAAAGIDCLDKLLIMAKETGWGRDVGGGTEKGTDTGAGKDEMIPNVLSRLRALAHEHPDLAYTYILTSEKLRPLAPLTQEVFDVLVSLGGMPKPERKQGGRDVGVDFITTALPAIAAQAAPSDRKKRILSDVSGFVRVLPEVSASYTELAARLDETAYYDASRCLSGLVERYITRAVSRSDVGDWINNMLLIARVGLTKKMFDAVIKLTEEGELGPPLELMRTASALAKDDLQRGKKLEVLVGLAERTHSAFLMQALKGAPMTDYTACRSDAVVQVLASLEQGQYYCNDPHKRVSNAMRTFIKECSTATRLDPTGAVLTSVLELYTRAAVEDNVALIDALVPQRAVYTQRDIGPLSAFYTTVARLTEQGGGGTVTSRKNAAKAVQQLVKVSKRSPHAPHAALILLDALNGKRADEMQRGITDLETLLKSWKDVAYGFVAERAERKESMEWTGLAGYIRLAEELGKHKAWQAHAQGIEADVGAFIAGFSVVMMSDVELLKKILTEHPNRIRELSAHYKLFGRGNNTRLYIEAVRQYTGAGRLDDLVNGLSASIRPEMRPDELRKAIQLARGITFDQAAPFINYAVTRMLGRFVVEPSDSSYTDGRTIYLPSFISDFPDRARDLTENRNVGLYVADAVHECLHIRKGTFEINMKDFLEAAFQTGQGDKPLSWVKSYTLEFFMDLFNIIEDARIEHQYHHDSDAIPQFVRLIDGSNRHYFGQLEESLDEHVNIIDIPEVMALMAAHLIMDRDLSERILSEEWRRTPDSEPIFPRQVYSSITDGAHPVVERGNVVDSLRWAYDTYIALARWLQPTYQSMRHISPRSVDLTTNDGVRVPFELHGISTTGEGKVIIIGEIVIGQHLTIDFDALQEAFEKKADSTAQASLTASATSPADGDINSKKPAHAKQTRAGKPPSVTEAEYDPEGTLIETHHFPEWDCRHGAYTRLAEVQLRDYAGENHAYIERFNRKYGSTIENVRETFLKYSKRRRGIMPRVAEPPEEYNHDAVIEMMLDAACGVTPREDIYDALMLQTSRVRRAILLDRSGSTVGKTLERIKDTALQLGEAMETVGDPFGVYAFCSSDTTLVSRLKQWHEPWSASTMARVANISSMMSNRDGAAARFMLHEFEPQDGLDMSLFWVSDGWPNDVKYEDKYALEDTLNGLAQLRDAGIKVFYFNIDRGRDISYIERFREVCYMALRVEDPAKLAETALIQYTPLCQRVMVNV